MWKGSYIREMFHRLQLDVVGRASRCFNMFHLGCPLTLAEQGNPGGSQPGGSPVGYWFSFSQQKVWAWEESPVAITESHSLRWLVFLLMCIAEISSPKKHLENFIFLVNITHPQGKCSSVGILLIGDIPQEVIDIWLLSERAAWYINICLLSVQN